MTRDEILNMEAGREMDALVAEKVMGQTDFSHPGFYWQEKNYADGDGWEGFYCPNCDASQGDTGKCCQRYSHDIAAAWEVVEKLRLSVIPVDDEYLVGKFDGYIDDITGIIDGYIGGTAYDVRDHIGLANTAPLAICRAALLAVMENDG